jgi:N-acetylglucosaminyldiphosphoundecaprenol N-acetyl-beta-D-mannosaminyltransferase
MPRKRIKLGPACLDLLDRTSVIAEIQKLVERRLPSQVITFNALMYNCALEDENFRETVNNAALVVSDSAGISWAAKLLSGAEAPRHPGIDLIYELCGLAESKGYGVFFLGSAPGTAEAAAAKLKSRFPRLKIAGTRHGYFRKEEQENMEKLIRAAAPDILFAGLSIPRQEKWIASCLARLGVPVVMGVGGSFDVISGKLKRAPVWMRNTGLEWLYRTLRQPWRFFRIASLPLFVLNVIEYKFGVKKVK